MRDNFHQGAGHCEQHDGGHRPGYDPPQGYPARPEVKADPFHCLCDRRDAADEAGADSDEKSQADRGTQPVRHPHPADQVIGKQTDGDRDGQRKDDLCDQMPGIGGQKYAAQDESGRPAGHVANAAAGKFAFIAGARFPEVAQLWPDIFAEIPARRQGDGGQSRGDDTFNILDVARCIGSHGFQIFEGVFDHDCALW